MQENLNTQQTDKLEEITILEAEDAVLGPNLTIRTLTDTDTPCVGNFINSTDYIDFSYRADKAGEYIIQFKTDRNNRHEVRYRINGADSHNLEVPDGTGMRYSNSEIVILEEGENSIRFIGFWGYLNIDHLTVQYNYQPPYDYGQVSTNLVNPNANSETRALYDYLRANYGKKIITGYTGQSSGGMFDTASETAGAVSKIYDIDFNSITDGYAYDWSNTLSTQVFGSVDNGQVDAAIEHHQAGNIITAQWHWYAPSGGQGTDLEGARGESAKTTTFSSENTNFDIIKAVNPENEEYDWVIQDIDQVAEALKELQDAGVPVLWRPLHEASGGWFWWGADKQAFVALWDIMYDRMTNYHGLNNLIWVLGQAYPENAWLVDHSKYDIIGFDNYPGAYNYTSQKQRIQLCREQGQHEKMVALTETGPIPDPELNRSQDAMYSYFVAWARESLEQFNTPEHFRYVYGSDYVITRD